MEERIKSTAVHKVLLTAGLFSLILLHACQYESMSESDFSGGSGTGGSMARFTIAGNHLYTVDQYSLKVFDVTNPRQPEFKISKSVGFDVETIFPLNKNLFLGTSSGMYIYDISSPASPQKISYFEHIISCDPVVADGNYAYVTLSSSSQRCWRGTNELQIIDIRNLQKPVLIKQYPLSGPRGLSIRNDSLWVCDSGLKILDTRNKQDIKLLVHFPDISAYDIILNKNLALVSGETGFVQYKLENNTIHKLSEIKVLQLSTH
jgi:hypothetical protein